MVMNSARIFYVLEGITLNINNLTLQNGNTTGEGGAIYYASNSTNNTLMNCTFIGNHASDGGAIYYNANPENNTVIDCDFIDNWQIGVVQFHMVLNQIIIL